MSHVKHMWKCGHARRGTALRNANSHELEKWAIGAGWHGWQDIARQELAERALQCPACARASRRAFRAAINLTLAAIVVLLLGFASCEARAAICAPYTPADGRTCAPPTRLRWGWGGPVCLCPAEGMARR